MELYKYVGKYRVVCEFAWNTLKPIKHDTWIYCSNGGQIYRYSDQLLVFYRPNSRPSAWLEKLTSAGVELDSRTWLDDETEIYFDEKYINIVAEIVKARTLGCDIPPHSKRNLKLMDWYRDGKHKKYYL